MKYSVLTEPVIPVIWPDGNEEETGIKDLFIQAHRIKDIGGSNPLERYAVMRLLIAFAMDMLHPETGYDRADLLQAGAFDKGVLDAYIQECECNGERFNLFDSEHPFLQSKYDEKLDEKALKPAAVIVHTLPSGNNHIFIDHRLSENHSLSFPEAFRALCASYYFCVSGTAGPSSVNNTPPLTAVMIGKNLFETIVLNMVSVAEAAPLPYGCGETPWRKDRKIIPREEVASVSLLEGMTWMPRRITLVPDQNGVTVSKVYCQAGLNFKGNDLWNDPHVPRFRKKDDSFGTVKPENGRAVWRDAGTLLYDHGSKYVRQPLAIRCLLNLFDEEELPEWIPVRTAGLVTNQAAYTGWVEDQLSLPASLFYEQEKADLFREDITAIETMQAQIYSSVQRNFDKPRSSSPSDEHETASQCQMYFLKEAHDMMFGDAIFEISGSVKGKEHAEHFCKAIRDIISRTLEQVLHAAGNDTESLLKQIETEKWIWISYHKIKKEREEKYART